MAPRPLPRYQMIEFGSREQQRAVEKLAGSRTEFLRYLIYSAPDQMSISRLLVNAYVQGMLDCGEVMMEREKRLIKEAAWTPPMEP